MRERNPEIRPNPELPLFRVVDEAAMPQSSGVILQKGTEQAHARRTDPQTSHEAAKSVVNIGPTRELILLILRNCGPQQDQDIVEYFLNTARNDRDWDHLRNTTEQSIRTRRKELVRMKLVEACGEGKSRSGRPCQIWRLRHA